jgi:hypothetical protein
MRSTLLAAVAASLLATPAAVWSQERPRPAPPAPAPAAAPAQAGASVAPTGAWSLEDREDWLVGRLHRAQDEHDIDGAEAERVYKEVGAMRDFKKRLTERHGGSITAGERNAQEKRLDALVSQIHWLNQSAFQRPW